jgi:hypothetical protein
MELARASQVCVDPGLPTRAGVAIGLHHIFIEPERDGGFRLAGQWRPATTDQLIATTQFSMAKKIVQQFGCVIGIVGHWLAEVFYARAFLPRHGRTSSKHTTYMAVSRVTAPENERGKLSQPLSIDKLANEPLASDPDSSCHSNDGP